MYITVKKIKDAKFNGEHPNGIFENYAKSGKLVGKLEVGQYIGVLSDDGRFMRTSEITEVNVDTFHTLNSIYSYKLKNSNE